ncbi:MAG: ornithine carbamoyltransferase [Betaproteobacteria bacterium TMED156]|nr:MAG: ornithine carbamoyltransferase [Betaproteobacteria bacterium TMED156]
MRHFLKFSDLNKNELVYLLERTKRLKNGLNSSDNHAPFRGKTLVMIFEKQSTRTRLSFEIGMQQLGGSAVYLNTRDTQLGRGEAIEDAAKVVSRMCDLVMIRTYEQKTIESFSINSKVPVINGLTNEYHPCQILADIFTFTEYRGSIEKKIVTWIGDKNNVCNAWIEAASILDFNLRISCPPEYLKDISTCKNVSLVNNPSDACSGADLVTTDVWTSMGFESENAKRIKAFQNWSVTKEKMALASPNALFMHCLPAHRGEEVDAEVIDGPQSVVWEEAENRLHAQKALMEYLLLGFNYS